MSSDEQISQPQAPTKEELRNYIWNRMAEYNISEITVAFSGSGDDGDVVDIDCPEYQLTDPVMTTPLTDINHNYDKPYTFVDMVRDVALDLATSPTVPDWWNGEGGNGELTFTAADRTVEVVVNQCRIEYDTFTRTL